MTRFHLPDGPAQVERDAQMVVATSRRANPRQDRVAISIAFPVEKLLMGAKRRHPSADFLANVADTNRGRVCDLPALDRERLGPRCIRPRCIRLRGFGRPRHFREMIGRSRFYQA